MAASLKAHKNLCEEKLGERVLHIQGEQVKYRTQLDNSERPNTSTIPYPSYAYSAVLGEELL